MIYVIYLSEEADNLDHDVSDLLQLWSLNVLVSVDTVVVSAAPTTAAAAVCRSGEWRVAWTASSRRTCPALAAAGSSTGVALTGGEAVLGVSRLRAQEDGLRHRGGYRGGEGALVL